MILDVLPRFIPVEEWDENTTRFYSLVLQVSISYQPIAKDAPDGFGTRRLIRFAFDKFIKWNKEIILKAGHDRHALASWRGTAFFL